MLSSLPDEMKPHYERLLKADSEEDAVLIPYIKAADKISALIKCIEEEQMGNRDFSSAKKSTENIIKGLNMPEADYFMSHFIQGYCMTLDEQQSS